ncbi:TetR/AcrR family transcriptional regulator, partial [Staphylococcus succinus]
MEKQKITKQLIVQTAQALIQDTQQAEISLSQIASVLNITHAAIYKHFDNKRALWTAVCKDWFLSHIIHQID